MLNLNLILSTTCGEYLLHWLKSRQIVQISNISKLTISRGPKAQVKTRSACNLPSRLCIFYTLFANKSRHTTRLQTWSKIQKYILKFCLYTVCQ